MRRVDLTNSSGPAMCTGGQVSSNHATDRAESSDPIGTRMRELHGQYDDRLAGLIQNRWSLLTMTIALGHARLIPDDEDAEAAYELLGCNLAIEHFDPTLSDLATFIRRSRLIGPLKKACCALLVVLLLLLAGAYYLGMQSGASATAAIPAESGDH